MNHPKRFQFSTVWGLLICLLASPLAAGAQAPAVIYVKGTVDEIANDGNCTLREAILAANTDAAVDRCPAGSGADTIIVPVGVYPLSLEAALEDQGLAGDLDILAPLTIRGTGDRTTILGYPAAGEWYQRDRILQVHASAGQVILQNLILQDSKSLYDGAAIWNSAALRLENCALQGNGLSPVDTYRGGGIFNEGVLWLLDSLISENYAINGGGLYNRGTAFIQNSRLDGNIGDDGDYAGAIYNRGELDIQNSSLSGNYSGGGSAIYNLGSLQVSDSHLDNNSARFVAPALDNHGTAVLHNITANDNIAGHYLGAMRTTGAMTVTLSTVNGNRSYDYGGAIGQEGGWMFLEDVEIAHNTSDGQGGGLYLAGDASRLVRVNIHDNRSQFHQGGGIYLASTMTLVDSAVNSNFAGSDGGGVYIHNGVAVFDGGVIQGNQAGDLGVWAESKSGGGVYQRLGILNFNYTLVQANQAIENGGGVVSGGQMDAYGITFSDNYAGMDGGGLYNTGAAYLLVGSTLAGNNAQDDGGGAYNNGELHLFSAAVRGNWGWGQVDWNLGGGGIANAGLLDMNFTDIADNWTIWTGGGVSNSGKAVITQSTLRGNVARDWAGGIWQGGGSLELINSTLHGNRGDAGGGGLGMQGGSARLLNDTISGNLVALGWRNAAGGGLLSLGGDLVIQNTILAGNLDYSGGSSGTLDCYLEPWTTLNNLGHNLIGIIDDCNWVSAPGDQTGVLVAPLDARLLPLQRLDSSSTPLLPLMHASPALDEIDPASCPWNDQRQALRPQGAACDIGAFEALFFQVAVDIRPASTRNVIDPNSPYRVPVAILSTPGFRPAEEVDPATITFGSTGLEDSLYYLDGKRICASRDFNQDGVLDLVCEFVISRTGLQCGDSAGLLKAYSFDRRLITGQDMVLMSPCR